MREVIGKRVGVRWDPPALVYVYQLDQVLRLARIPLRNLEDEDVVDRVYEKHENHLLRGLERRYVQRMVEILRHHHGIESQKDKQTEGTTSERVSERATSVTTSHVRSVSKSGAHDVLTDQKEKSEKDVSGSVGIVLPKTNKLVDIKEVNSTPNNRPTRGSDILLLLNQASRSDEGTEHDVDNRPVGYKRNLEELPKSNRRKPTQGSDRETDKEILDLINKDLSRVQRDKRNLVNIVKTNDVITDDKAIETSSRKDGRQEEMKPSRWQEPKSSVDESEDTDVDLQDLDIPLDPEDPLDDDDFWS